MTPATRGNSRFVYRANACGAGGRFTRVGDTVRPFDLPVRSSVSLPVTGGRGISVFDGYGPCEGALNLVLSGPIICRASTEADEEKGTTKTSVSAEASEVRVHGGLEIPFVKANLDAFSVGRDDMAVIRTANLALPELRLGDRTVLVDLDHDTFRRCDTYAEVEKEIRGRKEVQVSSSTGVIVATVVKGISLIGEEDKRIRLVQPNRIYWENFGWIILGEILISKQYRRLTMVRLELGSPVKGSAAVGEVETDGHTLPA